MGSDGVTFWILVSIFSSSFNLFLDLRSMFKLIFVRSIQSFNPDCAVASYCDLKIFAAMLVSRFLPTSGRLLLDIFINMPTSQNRSNCAFRCGFLHIAMDSTAQSEFKME